MQRWSQDVPTKPGQYWFKSSENTPAAIREFYEERASSLKDSGVGVAAIVFVSRERLSDAALNANPTGPTEGLFINTYCGRYRVDVVHGFWCGPLEEPC